MVKHNVLLIVRGFLRFKGVFTINLVGLSTAFASALFIYLWVADEVSFDQYHTRVNEIFQVLENQQQDGQIVTSWQSADLLARELEKEIPEVELATVTTPPNFFPSFTLTANDNPVKGTVKFADEDFFRIFSYPLIEGNASQALTDKANIVISESLAKKLFSTSHNAVGKQINWQFPGVQGLTVVSGVFKDVPVNSSEKFDFVLPFDAFRQLMGFQGTGVNWDNSGPFFSYVVLRKDTEVDQVTDKINKLLHAKSSNSKSRKLFLKSYGDNYLYGHYENGIQAGGRIDYVILFFIVAVSIILIASINFVNLSTARALQRSKSVGIQRIIGAQKKTLVSQFLQEAFIMVLLSAIVGLLLAGMLLPLFNGIMGKELVMTVSPEMILTFVLLIIVITLLSGIYPAFYLSRFNPARAIKGQFTTSVAELSARKGLIVFQFLLTIVFLVSVVVIQKQMEFIQTKNLGFNKQNVLYFEVEGKVSQHTDAFLAELKTIPGITMASGMLGNLIHEGAGGGTPGTVTWQDKTVIMNSAAVNYGMIELLGMEMKEGRTFSKDIASDADKVIYNEAAIEALGIDNPVGKKVGEREILGVVKDFHYQSFHEPVKPYRIRLEPAATTTIMVKIEAGKERDVIDRLQKFYASYNPGFVFSYDFLDKNYQAQYAGEKRVSALSNYAAGLTIMISCLGLFGLVYFTVERRIKEIGIRKVLGSQKLDIILLLAGNFSKLIVLSILIALPLSYYLSRAWLDDFAYHIELKWWYFLLAAGSAWLVSCATMASLILKAARVNPVNLLRSE